MLGRSTAIGLAAAVLDAPEVGVELVAGGGRGVQASKYSPVETRRRRSLAAASATRQVEQLGSHPRPAARGRGRRRSAGSGAAAEHHLAGPALARLVGAQDVLQLDDVRGRLDLVEVERGDPVDVLEDPGELAGHPLDLLLGEAEPGQLRDVQYLFSLDHGGDSRRPAS